jgi:hypothetical protein
VGNNMNRKAPSIATAFVLLSAFSLILWIVPSLWAGHGDTPIVLTAIYGCSAAIIICGKEK